MRCDFGYPVRTSRVKGRSLALRGLSGSEHFRRASLIKTDVSARMFPMIAHALKKTKGSKRIRVGGIFRILEGDLYMGLRAEIINFRRLSGFDHATETS